MLPACLFDLASVVFVLCFVRFAEQDDSRQNVRKDASPDFTDYKKRQR